MNFCDKNFIPLTQRTKGESSGGVEVRETTRRVRKLILQDKCSNLPDTSAGEILSQIFPKWYHQSFFRSTMRVP
jgi:hypothetical protein